MRIFPSILPFLPEEKGTIGRPYKVSLRGGGIWGEGFHVLKRPKQSPVTQHYIITDALFGLTGRSC